MTFICYFYKDEFEELEKRAGALSDEDAVMEWFRKEHNIPDTVLLSVYKPTSMKEDDPEYFIAIAGMDERR